MNELEKSFNNDMVSIYTESKKECHYTPTRFLQMVSSIGGVATAKKLINRPDWSDGFNTLKQHDRIDLSVEAHALNPKYAELFTEEELDICRERLLRVGYDFNRLK